MVSPRKSGDLKEDGEAFAYSPKLGKRTPPHSKGQGIEEISRGRDLSSLLSSHSPQLDGKSIR